VIKMLMEFLSHALALNLGWIAMLIFGNLHWLFALVAYVLIANNGKRFLWPFLLTMGLLYAVVDIKAMFALVFASMILFIPVNFLLEAFLKNTSLEKHQLKIIVVLFFVFTFTNTFLFRLPGG